MIPSAPPRSAVLKPFWICCGEPSVAIVFDVQPSFAAASATILPCVWQAAAPQLMNTSFLPVGMVLPTGVVTVIALGRLVACATMALAWSTAELAPAVAVVDGPALAVALPESELLDPHPATATSAAARAAAPRPRRYLPCADVRANICTLLLVDSVSWVRDPVCACCCSEDVRG